LDRALLAPTFDFFSIERDIENAYSAVAELFFSLNVGNDPSKKYHVGVLPGVSPVLQGDDESRLTIGKCDARLHCRGWKFCYTAMNRATSSNPAENITRLPQSLRECIRQNQDSTELTMKLPNDGFQHCANLYSWLNTLSLQNIDLAVEVQRIESCLASTSVQSFMSGMNAVVDLQYALGHEGRCNEALTFAYTLFYQLFILLHQSESSGNLMMGCSDDVKGQGFIMNSHCFSTSSVVPSQANTRTVSIIGPSTAAVANRLDAHWAVQAWVLLLQCHKTGHQQNVHRSECSKEFYLILKDLAMFASNIVACSGEETYRYRSCTIFANVITHWLVFSDSSLRGLALTSYLMDPQASRQLGLGKVLEVVNGLWISS
jgi:hypothetical protein